MDTAFNGEHLLPGALGQFFIVLSFGSALFSAIAYYFATNDKSGNNSWRNLARYSFFTNTVSVIGIGACLYYIILNHLFEYYYAFEHSSRALPIYYIISSFWDGQEGSFWLWTFWQSLLGSFLIWKIKSWESPVMTVISFSQALLATFLLGIEIFGTRIGSSPFILLRDALNLKESAPIFADPEVYKNYLSYIKDGNGMNPLLQNYWMVIHPPTLFLGFGSMIIPFAFAIAGLWQKRYTEWVKMAIPYGLFAMMVLGTGIIMGAFWAYESLTFGGFWAWDPVENASIIPWLILVGAVHVLIVYKNTGHSYITATIMTLLSFVLVLYASFLTRSGILGDTSVHSFTDAGMFWHLAFDVIVFLVIGVVLLVVRWKELPVTKKDEDTYSREFWMFVGSVFLCLACFHLVVVSSIPVWNEVFGTKLAPPTDPVKHYNIIQASFAVVVTLLTGITQFLKYKKTDITRFFITTGVYLGVSVLITGAVAFLTGVSKLNFLFILVMLGSIYTIIANGKVLAEALKGKFKLAGSAVAHIGFGLMLVGALIAAGTSKVISENTAGTQYSEEFIKGKNNPLENITLYRNTPVQMGKYQVTYIGDSIAPPNHYFKMQYKAVDDKGNVTEEFILKPNAQANRKMGLISSPDTRHYLFSDIYTHINMSNAITYDETAEAEGHEAEDDDSRYEAPLVYEVAVGDTLPFREGYVLLKHIQQVHNVKSIELNEKDLAVEATLQVVSNGKTWEAKPIYLIKNSNAFDFAHKIAELGIKLRFSKVLPEKNSVEITLYQEPPSSRKYVVMRAIQFPFINFLWAGTIIMVLGTVMAIFRRNKELKVV